MSDVALHVYKHLHSSGTCRDSSFNSAESFTILDSAASSFQVKTKEAQQPRRLALPLYFKSFFFFLSILLNFIMIQS